MVSHYQTPLSWMHLQSFRCNRFLLCQTWCPWNLFLNLKLIPSFKALPLERCRCKEACFVFIFLQWVGMYICLCAQSKSMPTCCVKILLEAFCVFLCAVGILLHLLLLCRLFCPNCGPLDVNVHDFFFAVEGGCNLVPVEC